MTLVTVILPIQASVSAAMMAAFHHCADQFKDSALCGSSTADFTEMLHASAMTTVVNCALPVEKLEVTRATCSLHKLKNSVVHDMTYFIKVELKNGERWDISPDSISKVNPALHKVNA